MLSLIHRSPGGTIEFMRNLLLALLLLASPFLRSDEGRFDPPLKGAYLGVSLGKIRKSRTPPRPGPPDCAAATCSFASAILTSFRT